MGQLSYSSFSISQSKLFKALALLDLNGLKIATKVFPAKLSAHGAHLKPIFYESLKALKTEKVDIFYLHAPDYTTPFEETIRYVNELHQEGRFERVRVDVCKGLKSSATHCA